ncbi:MAG: hypothetical protein CVU38_12075 [Chloroflexi bacterium HGW-Chloroflexi-1]|nr:MAG: hypothetical protein CVU38_12075 [Chloroflexi bacterium HGW-Chloroflexi-1]
MPIYQPTNLPTYQPTNLPTYQSTNLPIYQPTNLPIYQSTIPPGDEETSCARAVLKPARVACITSMPRLPNNPQAAVAWRGSATVSNPG